MQRVWRGVSANNAQTTCKKVWQETSTNNVEPTCKDFGRTLFVRIREQHVINLASKCRKHHANNM